MTGLGAKGRINKSDDGVHNMVQGKQTSRYTIPAVNAAC